MRAQMEVRVDGAGTMHNARVAARRADGASRRARVPSMGYRDKPQPSLRYASSPVPRRHVISLAVAPGVVGFVRTIMERKDHGRGPYHFPNRSPHERSRAGPFLTGDTACRSLCRHAGSSDGKRRPPYTPPRNHPQARHPVPCRPQPSIRPQCYAYRVSCRDTRLRVTCALANPVEHQAGTVCSTRCPRCQEADDARPAVHWLTGAPPDECRTRRLKHDRQGTP